MKLKIESVGNIQDKGTYKIHYFSATDEQGNTRDYSTIDDGVGKQLKVGATIEGNVTEKVVGDKTYYNVLPEKGKKSFAPRGKSPEERASIEAQTAIKEIGELLRNNSLPDEYADLGVAYFKWLRRHISSETIQSPTPKPQSHQKSISDPLPPFGAVAEAGKWFTERGITKDLLKTFGKADTAAEIEIIGVNEWAQSLKIELIKAGIGV